MKIITWRNTALVLAAVCMFQRWQSCSRAPDRVEPVDPVGSVGPAMPALPSSRAPSSRFTAPSAPSLDDAAGPGGKSFHGFRVPAWAMHLLPQPGETMRGYRDRMLPLARMAIAPQRARVARMRDDFAHLDPHQRAELDAAVAEATTAIRDRVASAFASGELRPAAVKPMTGVAIARDVLDIVERGNTRFVSSLSADQRTRLASHRFDFADYLVFTAPWEDALHALD
ncbi:MAG TPA: hypothetical protein VFK02_04200 [Kofleriaceae bacterium]|nr:hypothetical protein [Kofleriaceae bacterium]